MKHQAHTVDVRIKEFMDRKIAEFPELRDQTATHVNTALRGYMWEDIVGFFKKERVS